MRAALVLAAATLSACTASAVQAQTPAPVSNAVQILSTSRLATLADSLPAGAANTIQIARWEGLANSFSRRDTSGVPERHNAFTDIFVVQRGRARLLYGGTVEGERASSPGEWRGGTIRGGTETEIKPGDIVVIPAGVPHHLLLPPGESFYYFVFKVAKPAR